MDRFVFLFGSISYTVICFRHFCVVNTQSLSSNRVTRGDRKISFEFIKRFFCCVIVIATNIDHTNAANTKTNCDLTYFTCICIFLLNLSKN